MAGISCKTCDRGELVRRKRYRMSGIVVFIGYLLLIPSMLGILLGLFTLGATGKATSETVDQARAHTAQELRSAGVPEPVIADVAASREPASAALAPLSASQRRAVTDAQSALSASMAGAGLGTAVAGGAALAIVFTSLVGGLLGWLLTMKKTILQCTNCQAVVAAS